MGAIDSLPCQILSKEVADIVTVAVVDGVRGKAHLKTESRTIEVRQSSAERASDGTALVRDEVLEDLRDGVDGEVAELLGPDGLLSQVTKAVWEQSLMRS